jgi:putative transposase
VGTEWLLDGRVFRIVRQVATNQFVAHDLKFGVEHILTESEILTQFANHELSFAEAGDEANPRTDRPTSLPPIELSAHERRALEQRWQAIEPLTHLGRKPTLEEIRDRAMELAQQSEPCSPRTLRRLLETWNRSGGNRLALIPRHGRKGGRGKSRRHGLLQRFPQLSKFVNQGLKDVYLTTARRPAAAVVRRVLDDLQRHNARVSAARAIPIPRPSSLARAVARRIRQFDPWELDRARWGRRIADQRNRPTRRQCLANRILERVEVDHSLLKVVVGTQAGPLGQPWLTVLIDYHSRMITGFCLGFEPPSYAVIMEAIRQAILPKTALIERFPRIRGTWPCYGIPERIVCDRGADLTSKDLEHAAFHLGIELDFMPPRSPHLKGTVESFFDNLNDQLLSTLPGRTFRSWEKRADYQPDDGPLLPYESLLEIIHLHLVDVYAQEKHPVIAQTRWEVWQQSAKQFPPGLPTSPDELVVLLAKTTERSLSSRGIELRGMLYMSDEVMALRAQLAALNLSTDRLTIRYNPWDLGAIWVLNPQDRRYIKATSVDSALCGMTEYQWRVLKRAVRDRFDDPDHLLSLAASRNAIRDVAEAAMTKPSRKRRLRAARFLQKHPEKQTAMNPAAESEGDWHSISEAAVDHPARLPPHLDSSGIQPSPGAVPEPADPPLDTDSKPVNVEDWEVSS